MVTAVSKPRFSLQKSCACSRVTNHIGAEYTELGQTFDRCTFELRADNQWVRFEIIAPNDTRAWSNPFDLTELRKAQT